MDRCVIGDGLVVAGDYYYYVSFAVLSSGIIVEESELSLISSVQTIAGSHKITVTIPKCTETLATGVTAQCNARVLYRISPTSGGIAYRLTTIADNSTTSYTDNTLADGTIRANFDNQSSPISSICEIDDNNQIWFVDASNPTDVYPAIAGRPWAAPTTGLVSFDGAINCIKRCFRTLIIGTDRSLWIQDGL